MGWGLFLSGGGPPKLMRVAKKGCLCISETKEGKEVVCRA